MNVRFSPEADADLADIEAHIGLDNPTRAADFGRALAEAAEQIGEVPFAFQCVPHRPDLRRRVFRGYLIIYRVAGSEIEIARVLHGSRNVSRLLGIDDT